MWNTEIRGYPVWGWIIASAVGTVILVVIGVTLASEPRVICLTSSLPYDECIERHIALSEVR